MEILKIIVKTKENFMNVNKNSMDYQNRVGFVLNQYERLAFVICYPKPEFRENSMKVSRFYKNKGEL